ncbi:MAG: hypothetical protein ACJ73S_25875, partial [Mycobacteriales bacterium]
MRLLGGVCPAADHGVWVRDPAGRPVDATAPEVDLPPGTPVAVGPRAAGADAAGPALAELAALVAAAGGVAAGGGVDLGGGFRSARTDGGAGDRRDGVLAALTVAAARDRLGDRTAVLVGLFGPEATRPLGAAAQAAVEEGRWAALRFAAAASDLLGPEQLVSLLASRAPDGVDPFPHGLPSVVAGHLAEVLREVPRPRRLDLLADLWEQVCAAGTVRQRSRRLRASQSRKDRINDLWARRRRYEDDELTTHVRHALGPNPAVADTALWRPRPAYWVRRADRALHDAWAGTVLARLTVTAVDEGLEEALARHRHEIEAAADRMTAPEAALSTRAVTGLTGLPARPGSLLMFLRDRTRPGEPLNRGQATSVWQRLAHARDYAELATYSVADFINLFIREDSVSVRDAVAGWLAGPMAAWRERVGYFSADRLDGWNHHSLLVGEPGTSLGERLRAEPDRPAAELETVGDMFWYVELVDAQARLRGLAAADVQPDIPDVHVPVADPDPPEEDPLVPRRDSIPLAAAGAAQLAGLGGQVPRRCRTWSDLVTGLLAGAAVAESLTGSFPVPAGLAAADGTELPGTDASVEVARTHRQLVEWSSSMANCIAGPRYAELAATGRAALIALRAPDGRILANAELRPAAGRWRVVELEARFNQDPGEELRHRVRAWAAGLPGPAAPDTAAAPPARRARSGRHRPAH